MRAASAAAAVLICVAATMARANIVDAEIGVAVQQESICKSGKPISDRAWNAAPAEIEALVQSYPAAATETDPSDLRKVFAPSEDGGVYGLEGAGPPQGAMSDAWLNKSAPENAQTALPVLKLKKLVVGFDSAGARGVWSAQRPSSTDPSATDEVDYVIDFKMSGFWVAHWKIWRIRVFRPPEAPDFADSFCHKTELKPLW